MIPIAMTRGYDLTLSQLSTAALGDLRALLNAVEGESPARQQSVLQEAFPEVFNPYAAASSAVSASFYEEVREYANVGGSFDAEMLDGVDRGRWSALVGFGTAPRTLEQGGAALAYSLLSGGLTSILSEMAADTIVGNGSLDSDIVAFQRVPKPGCCSWCGILASRGAAYTSQEAAEGVVGRGTPIREPGTKRRRGGVAKGIRPRGSRQMGESFHDHCKCRGVPVFGDNYAEMQADADKYFESYAGARNQVNKGLTLEYDQYKSPDGSLKNKYRWVDAGGTQISPKDKTKLIAKAMRLDLDIK